MFLLPEKTVRLHVGFRGVGGTLLDRWYHRFHVSHTETVGKNVCYILNIRSSKNTGLQTQDMISDKKLSLFHPVLSKLSVFVFRYRLRNSSSPSISRYINKIYFRVLQSQRSFPRRKKTFPSTQTSPVLRTSRTLEQQNSSTSSKPSPASAQKEGCPEKKCWLTPFEKMLPTQT